MPISNPRRLATCVALVAGFAQAAAAADILINDAKSQPESLTVAPDGTLIVGSASTPFVYKIAPARRPPEVSSTPAPRVPAPSSSACWWRRPTHCGHAC